MFISVDLTYLFIFLLYSFSVTNGYYSIGNYLTFRHIFVYLLIMNKTINEVSEIPTENANSTLNIMKTPNDITRKTTVSLIATIIFVLNFAHSHTFLIYLLPVSDHIY